MFPGVQLVMGSLFCNTPKKPQSRARACFLGVLMTTTIRTSQASLVVRLADLASSYFTLQFSRDLLGAVDFVYIPSALILAYTVAYLKLCVACTDSRHRAGHTARLAEDGESHSFPLPINRETEQNCIFFSNSESE